MSEKSNSTPLESPRSDVTVRTWPSCSNHTLTSYKSCKEGSQMLSKTNGTNESSIISSRLSCECESYSTTSSKDTFDTEDVPKAAAAQNVDPEIVAPLNIDAGDSFIPIIFGSRRFLMGLGCFTGVLLVTGAIVILVLTFK